MTVGRRYGSISVTNSPFILCTSHTRSLFGCIGVVVFVVLVVVEEGLVFEVYCNTGTVLFWIVNAATLLGLEISG